MRMNDQGRRDREETAQLLALAWPCILENLTTTLVSLVDTAMVGSIGAVATAAVGLCSSPTWLMNGLARALGVGGTAIAARAVGAGDGELAGHIARQVFRASLCLSLLIFLTMFLGAPVIPALMQAKGDVQREAAMYLRIVSLSYFVHYSALVMGALLRGAGDTRTPMIAGVAANVLNVAGNFLLIYPTRTVTLLGRPLTIWGAGLGTAGAAIATAAGMGLSGLFLLAHMASGRSRLRIGLSLKEKWDWPLLARVLRIALPAASERVAINGGQIVYAAMFASVGTAEVAAYHITCTIEAIGYMPANGFASAASALVGQKLGAGDPDAAQRAGSRSVKLSLALLTVIGVLMAALCRPLAALFTQDAQVRLICAGLIVICGALQPFNALSIVTQGALSGAGDTVRPFVYSLVTMWGVRMTVSLLLGFALGFGVYGIYFAMLVDLAVRSAMLMTRFGRGQWKTGAV